MLGSRPAMGLLLVGTLVTVCNGADPEPNILEYYGQVCEEFQLSMSCPRGYAIDMQAAVYGRMNLEACVDEYANGEQPNSTTCSMDVMSRTRTRCQDKQQCSVSVGSLALANFDPCPGTSKYINVTFNCVEQPLSYSGLQCEGKSIGLECLGEDEYIMIVQDVFYGRQDNTTCSHNSAILTTECSGSEHALDIISGLCNYKHDCTLYVRSSLLDDPCVGTYKYLNVEYSCIYCKNLNPTGDANCDFWASTGECENNYNWMYAYCYESCSSECQKRATCSDGHENCAYWAAFGECAVNPEYMRNACKYSCNLCPEKNDSLTSTVAPTTPPPPTLPEFPSYVQANVVCERTNDFISCPIDRVLRIHYATYGREDNITCPHDDVFTTDCPTEPYVFDRVQAVCNGRRDCQLRARSSQFGNPCEETYKYLTVYYTCQRCENYYADRSATGEQSCQRWAQEGECTKNPTWMLENCFESCSGCGYAECKNDKEDSLGEDVTCDGWAMRNECELNKEWMEQNCQKSCRACPPAVQSASTSTEEPGRTNDPATQSTTTAATAPTGFFSDIACEGNFLYLACPADLVYVEEAFYGRWDETSCPSRASDPIVGCSDANILRRLSELCGRLTQCTVHVDVGVLGNPCPQAYKYANVSYLCAAGCGQHGQCVGADTCRCDPGYSGATCEEYNCQQEGSGCNERGICTGAGTCSCYSGWSGSDDCSQYDCSALSDCSGHGKCTGPNKCLCYPYFEGDDCSSCWADSPVGSACLPCPKCGPHATCVPDSDAEGATDSYVGCYQDGHPGRDFEYKAWDGESTSTAACVEECRDKGYTYAGLQYGQECHCSRSFGRYGEADNCDMQCNGGPEGDICGGYYAMSVWKVQEGMCQCEEGFTGATCEECADGHTGPLCEPAEDTSPPSGIPSSTTARPPAGDGTDDVADSTPAISRAATEALVATTKTAPSETDQLPMTVVLDLPWVNSYTDSTREETQLVVLQIKQMLLDFYEDLFENLKEIRVIGLREGSVTVDHVLLFDERLSTDVVEQYQCNIMDSLADRGNTLGDTQVTVDKETGEKCEDDADADAKIILIIVICCVTPFGLLISLYCCLRRQKAKTELKKIADGTSKSFGYAGISGMTVLSGMSGAHKLSTRSSKIFDEKLPDDIDVPRQI